MTTDLCLETMKAMGQWNKGQLRHTGENYNQGSLYSGGHLFIIMIEVICQTYKTKEAIASRPTDGETPGQKEKNSHKKGEKGKT